MKGEPCASVLASRFREVCERAREAIMGPRFRVYDSDDVLGVELAGAMKNIVALAAGLTHGLGFGANSTAALITRGLAEITRYGVRCGAQPLTFAGLAGIGDLIATCFSPHGRNRRAGERLAKGESVAAVTAGPQVAEGVYTARSVYDRITRMGVEAPIMAAVYDVVYRGKPPLAAVEGLLARAPKPEAR